VHVGKQVKSISRARYAQSMAHKTWSLPPATPIVERLPRWPHVVGLLLAGLIVGVVGALIVVNYADSHTRPDPLNESGPWVAVMPGVAGASDISLEMNMEATTLTTGCGEWTIAYVQSGVRLTFSELPPAPARCHPEAAKAHTWFVTQLAATRSFSPAEFWSAPDGPTITFHGADGRALVAIATVPRSTSD